MYNLKSTVTTHQPAQLNAVKYRHPHDECDIIGELMSHYGKYQFFITFLLSLFQVPNTFHIYFKKTVAEMFFLVGVATGGIISGYLSDRFGRKTMLFISVVLQTIFACIALYFPNSFEVYLALRDAWFSVSS